MVQLTGYCPTIIKKPQVQSNLQIEGSDTKLTKYAGTNSSVSRNNICKKMS